MRRRRTKRERSPYALLGGAGLAALAGFAVGMYLMHKTGGLDSILRQLRPRENSRLLDDDEPSDSVYEMDGLAHDGGEYGSAEDELAADPAEEAIASEVEERVLSAFMNDPLLSRASVEISAESDGVVKLHGWMDAKDEVQHAATIAGGVPGVLAVANHIRVRRPGRARV